MDPLNERGCYVESKRLGEQMCAAFSRQYGVNTQIARICHTYGPTFDLENDTRVIPRSIKKILKGEDIVIYKDPSSMIQYTYVGDIVSGILCMLSDGKRGEAYNVCGDEILTMEEAIRYMIESDEGLQSRLIEMEPDENYAFGRGKGVHFVKLDSRKLKGIGWRQLFSPEEGFKRLINSYR